MKLFSLGDVAPVSQRQTVHSAAFFWRPRANKSTLSASVSTDGVFIGSLTQPEQHCVLIGWKEIATHLGKSVRTVQRYDNFGLPVRRPAGHTHGSVIAMRWELDGWVKWKPGTGCSISTVHNKFDGADRFESKPQEYEQGPRGAANLASRLAEFLCHTSSDHST